MKHPSQDPYTNLPGVVGHMCKVVLLFIFGEMRLTLDKILLDDSPSVEFLSNPIQKQLVKSHETIVLHIILIFTSGEMRLTLGN